MMESLKKFKFPIILLGIYLILGIVMPALALSSTKSLLAYLKEMLLIMPPVFLLMGLLEAWIPKDKIEVWLGNKSGIKGIVLSFVLGTLPTGPLYVAFPLAASLIKKGARISNMVIFLGTWAALKIPQLMVEAKFLGIRFTVVRFSLTLTFLLILGVLMELLMKKNYAEEINVN